MRHILVQGNFDANAKVERTDYRSQADSTLRKRDLSLMKLPTVVKLIDVRPWLQWRGLPKLKLNLVRHSHSVTKIQQLFVCSCSSDVTCYWLIPLLDRNKKKVFEVSIIKSTLFCCSPLFVIYFLLILVRETCCRIYSTRRSFVVVILCSIDLPFIWMVSLECFYDWFSFVCYKWIKLNKQPTTFYKQEIKNLNRVSLRYSVE